MKVERRTKTFSIHDIPKFIKRQLRKSVLKIEGEQKPPWNNDQEMSQTFRHGSNYIASLKLCIATINVSRRDSNLILIYASLQFLLVDIFIFNVNSFILPKFKVINNLWSLIWINNYIIFNSAGYS